MNHRPSAPHAVACPSPEQVTREHVQNLSIVIETLKPFILPMPRDPMSSIPQEAQRLDGEAAIAASTTFINACERLNKILADEPRWTMAQQNQLYHALNMNYAQQFEFLKSQTMAANHLSRPSFLLKPDLARLSDGSFIVYWGDIETPGAGLVGRGTTPAEAFQDFDAAYFRQDQIHIEPPAEETPEPQPKTPRKKK